MTKAIIYSKENCTYCEQAKNLLATKHIEFEEKKLGRDYTTEELLKIVPSARTVPQIFLDGQYVGGFIELKKKLTT